MNSRVRNLALACALLTLGAASHPDHSTTAHRPQGFAQQMDAGMQAMMKDMHAAGVSGNPDIDFLAMMIPHHEGAVEMARLELLYGKDPLTRRLAEEIIASQSTEIAAMKERLAILRKGEDPNPGHFPALHGTRGGSAR